MASSCPNCGALITCGCQERSTSDYKTACVNCIEAYEIRLQQEKIMIEQATAHLQSLNKAH